MTSISVPFNFIPRDYQLEMFQAMDGIEGQPETRMKRAFLRWHRRCGKDKACLAYMLKEMVARKGIYYYFLPNYQQGRKIIWEGIDKAGFKFMEHMPGFTTPGKPGSLVKRVNNQEMLMELTNGSIFRVIGTDNVDTIVGTNPVGCVFSEYAIQDPRAWDYIRPILAENGGWAIFNSTPRGRNHMYAMDLKVKRSDKWYYSELQTLYTDEPNYTGMVTMEAIDDERESGMDEDTIAQEFGVSYSAGTKGAYYSDMVARAWKNKHIGSFPYDPDRLVNTHWDLGYDDSTAIWFSQNDGSSINFIDYFEASGKPIAYYASILSQKGYRYATHNLPHDANHKGILLGEITPKILLEDALREHRVSSDINVVPRSPIQHGIDSVRSRFTRYRFNEGTTADAIQMVELYHRKYDAKRQVFLAQPVHDWTSHCCDALRTEAVAGDTLDNEFGDDYDVKVETYNDPYG
jgi:phage terminase large subunit